MHTCTSSYKCTPNSSPELTCRIIHTIHLTFIPLLLSLPYQIRIFLQSFFTEDPLLAPRRAALESRRDKLSLASTALSRIQVKMPLLTPQANSNRDSVLSNTVSQGQGQGQGQALPVASNNNNTEAASAVDIRSRAVSRITLTVAIGTNGIGLVVVDDDATNRITVKDLRKMPGGAVNPSEVAGILVGDEVERINGKMPSDLQDAVHLLKCSKDSVTITVLRK